MNYVKKAVVIAIFLLTGHTFATNVIALWDVVPDQIIEGKFKAGVVAFHETGVDVEFKVNGSVITTVTDPTYNDRTKVWEYWVELDAADYSDGAITVDAICSPEGSGHTARNLASITLYAHSGKSLTTGVDVWADCVSGDDVTGDGTEVKPYKTVKKAYDSA